MGARLGVALLAAAGLYGVVLVHAAGQALLALTLLVLTVVLMFFIAMPILAFMYYDMYYATQAAVQEVRKMRELRREIQIERMYGQ